MFRTIVKSLAVVILIAGSVVIGAIFSDIIAPEPEGVSQANEQQSSETPTVIASPTETIPPYTPLPSPTPSQTLKPAPTFEPPTPTILPSSTPSTTPSPTVSVNVSIPGLQGAETPTPTTIPGCEPREDWKLTYTVQFDDSLSSIASMYGTWVDDLAEANCITDKNLIVVGQVLRVPGASQPVVPEVECVPWEPLTPFDGMVTVPADGSITFNWRGPAAPINLIRIYRPDGSLYERVIELRQNETIELNDYLPQAGTYSWYVFPLDRNFSQISCHEGGPWTFTKPESSTPTPTIAAGGGMGS
jgi:LysM repeat protein